MTEHGSAPALAERTGPSCHPGRASHDFGGYRYRAQAATALCRAIAECDPADACTIMGAALANLSLGAPIPALFGVMNEASFWSDLASRDELKVYALACFDRLSPADQAAFLSFVQRRAA